MSSDFKKYGMWMVVFFIAAILFISFLPSIIGGAADAAQIPGEKLCTELTFCDQNE